MTFAERMVEGVSSYCKRYGLVDAGGEPDLGRLSLRMLGEIAGEVDAARWRDLNAAKKARKGKGKKTQPPATPASTTTQTEPGETPYG